MSDIKVGDIVEVSDDGNKLNYSGRGVVRDSLGCGWLSVESLDPKPGLWAGPRNFPQERLTLVASVTPVEVRLATPEEAADFERRAVVERHPGSQRFHELLAEIGALHDRKQADYGRDDDPFANVRASDEWGVAGWVGAMVRLTDKVRRLQALAQRGSLANESAVDSFLDISVYALIALILFEQEQA